MSLAMQKMAPARCVAPQAIVDNTSWTCYAIDTNGCKAVHLLVHFGAMDIAMAALKVQESDVLSSATALSSGTDITGADFSVSPATLPSATADNLFFLVSIPITGARKRYLNLVATGGDGSAGTYMTAVWFRESLDEAPNTAAKRNLSQHLIIAG